MKRIKPSTIEKCFRRLWLFAENQRRELELLCNAQLHPFDEDSADVPEARHVGVDENRKVEVLDDRCWIAILLAMADDQPMSVLVNIFDAPAFDSEVVIDQLDWRLVLLIERRLDHLERSEKTTQIVIELIRKVRSIEINLFFRLRFRSKKQLLAELTLAGWDS